MANRAHSKIRPLWLVTLPNVQKSSVYRIIGSDLSSVLQVSLHWNLASISRIWRNIP